jgi:hypothetical protein
MRSDLVSAIILALLVPFGYALAYAFASGNAAYWGLPSTLVSASWEETLAALAALIPVALALLYFSDSLFFIPEQFRGLRQVRFLTYLTIVAFVSFLVGAPKIVSIAFTIWAVLYGVFTMVLPAFSQSEKSYLERLQERAVASASAEKPTTISKFVDKFGPSAFLLIFGSAAVTWAAYCLGMQQARNQQDFWVSSSNQEEVLLAQYGDTLVFGVQAGDGTLQPKVIVRKLAEQPTALVPEHIEHLVPIGGERNNWWK